MADQRDEEILPILRHWPELPPDPAQMDRVVSLMVSEMRQTDSHPDAEVALFRSLTYGWAAAAIGAGLSWPLLARYLAEHPLLRWLLVLFAAACLTAPLLLLVPLSRGRRLPRLARPGGNAW